MLCVSLKSKIRKILTNVNRLKSDFGFGKKSMTSLVQDELNHFLATLEETKGQPVETSTLFNVPVVNAIWTVLTGERFESGDPKLDRTIQVFIPKDINFFNISVTKLGDYFCHMSLLLCQSY